MTWLHTFLIFLIYLLIYIVNLSINHLNITKQHTRINIEYNTLKLINILELSHNTLFFLILKLYLISIECVRAQIKIYENNNFLDQTSTLNTTLL